VNRDELNRAHFDPARMTGHYESFYQRANHPTRPLAFWIRYTVFSPAGRPGDAIGELWAVLFDGDTGQHAVAKQEYPIGLCEFRRDEFSVRVGDNELGPGRLFGACSGSGHGSADALSWDLGYDGDSPPLFLLPQRLYRGGFPKAKSLVPCPSAIYRGELVANSRTIDVTGWAGSQNHNWGSRHTDRYAFGQVAGFDDAPDSFLEVATAQAKIGPVRTPFLTFLVLRHGGDEHSLVSLRQAYRATASYRYFTWTFGSENDAVRIQGTITATPESFVGLNYRNPPGGTKYCLNTKIGSCRVTIIDKVSGSRDELRTRDRALFEILTDDGDDGITIRA
jgi:hypothetical protein